MKRSDTLVLLWDIDGTLLSTGGIGVFAWEEAVRDVLGSDASLRHYNTAGLTDVEISRLLVRELGGSGDATAARVLRRYEEVLPLHLHDRTGGVLPGVREILEHVPACPVFSLLLTGNTRVGGRAKLTHYGLVEYFGQDGAFADGTDDRVGIARRAIAATEDRLGPIERRRIHVIGDTPHDIHCGQAVGARTVAVATGLYTVEQLAGHQPWWLLGQLPDPVEFFAHLDG